MSTSKSAPARFVIVVPREDGSYEAFCIACHWQRNRKTREAATRSGGHHECPRRSDA